MLSFPDPTASMEHHRHLLNHGFLISTRSAWKDEMARRAMQESSHLPPPDDGRTTGTAAYRRNIRDPNAWRTRAIKRPRLGDLPSNREPDMNPTVPQMPLHTPPVPRYHDQQHPGPLYHQGPYGYYANGSPLYENPSGSLPSQVRMTPMPQNQSPMNGYDRGHDAQAQFYGQPSGHPGFPFHPSYGQGGEPSSFEAKWRIDGDGSHRSDSMVRTLAYPDHSFNAEQRNPSQSFQEHATGFRDQFLPHGTAYDESGRLLSQHPHVEERLYPGVSDARSPWNHGAWPREPGPNLPDVAYREYAGQFPPSTAAFPSPAPAATTGIPMFQQGRSNSGWPDGGTSCHAEPGPGAPPSHGLPQFQVPRNGYDASELVASAVAQPLGVARFQQKPSYLPDAIDGRHLEDLRRPAATTWETEVQFADENASFPAWAKPLQHSQVVQPVELHSSRDHGQPIPSVNGFDSTRDHQAMYATGETHAPGIAAKFGVSRFQRPSEEHTNVTLSSGLRNPYRTRKPAIEPRLPVAPEPVPRFAANQAHHPAVHSSSSKCTTDHRANSFGSHQAKVSLGSKSKARAPFEARCGGVTRFQRRSKEIKEVQGDAKSRSQQAENRSIPSASGRAASHHAAGQPEPRALSASGSHAMDNHEAGIAAYASKHQTNRMEPDHADTRNDGMPVPPPAHPSVHGPIASDAASLFPSDDTRTKIQETLDVAARSHLEGAEKENFSDECVEFPVVRNPLYESKVVGVRYYDRNVEVDLKGMVKLLRPSPIRAVPSENLSKTDRVCVPRPGDLAGSAGSTLNSDDELSALDFTGKKSLWGTTK
jgi:hypothetical protein